MSNYQIAFFIGLFGSVHCVGMCGPLAFAVPSFHNRWQLLVADKIVYNLGRIASYTLLGWLAGFAGRQLWLSGLQQGVSILSGVLIVLAGVSRLFKIRLSTGISAPLLAPFNRLLGYALRQRAGNLLIGILNGFLPCGFVYLALAGAINTGTPLTAAGFMLWFGLGTFPLMLAATISSAFASPVIRRRINKIVPYFMVCLGFWFVLRGLNLDIPYLSPAKPTATAGVCR